MMKNTLKTNAKNNLKIIVTGIMIAGVSGCASNARINPSMMERASGMHWEGKAIAYEVSISQPEPGVFSGGEQQPMTPLNQANLSVGTRRALQDLNSYLENNLPQGASLAHAGNSDLQLSVELTAYDKKGPAYLDHQFTESLAKGLLTLGLAPSDYEVIADFKVNYRLQDAEGVVWHENDYRVQESVDHQKGDFDFDDQWLYARQMMEKHINITLGDFFTEARGLPAKPGH